MFQKVLQVKIIYEFNVTTSNDNRLVEEMLKGISKFIQLKKDLEQPKGT